MLAYPCVGIMQVAPFILGWGSDKGEKTRVRGWGQGKCFVSGSCSAKGWRKLFPTLRQAACCLSRAVIFSAPFLDMHVWNPRGLGLKQIETGGEKG